MWNCSSIICLEQKTNDQRISDSFSETIEEVKGPSDFDDEVLRLTISLQERSYC